jgi:hypothetical protein
MSDAGGPKGQVLGVFKCFSKETLGDGKIMVLFQDAKDMSYSAWFWLTPEQAEYYTVGQSYEFKTTTP